MVFKNIIQDKSDEYVSLNKIKVLQLIRDGHDLTRSDIIRKSGLSAPTVTRIVEYLGNLNLVHSDGIGASIGGRPPQLIHFNSKSNYVIGIDIGATFIRSALSNLDGEFIFEINVPTNLRKGFSGVMEQTGELILKLSDRALQKSLKLWGIGIAVCGMVNRYSGMVEYSPVFGWRNVDIRAALSKYTMLNIAFGNVTHLIALGELLFGVGKRYRNFICINIGYGIGSGIIADGKLFSGADGIAGEIGHIVIDKHNPRKGLEGISGTLEALASGYGVADIAKERARSDTKSSLHALASEDLDARQVFEAAGKGDHLALEIINEVAINLSIGIDTLIKLFNTECIVLTGGLAQNGAILIARIRESLSRYSMSDVSRSVPVVSSEFGENAALIGSLSLILEKILLFESD
jgi:N-acetylglucosamine repressor